MTDIQKQLLALLRAGLNIEGLNTNLFSKETDWESLYSLAIKQTVEGIVFDGIQQLPLELRPERRLYLKWCNDILCIEGRNQQLNKEVDELYAILRNRGVEPILMKGQGVAQFYPTPLRRQCGDIDLYTGHEDYEGVNSLLRLDATDECEENYKHVHLERHGVAIENHKIMISLSTPWYNRRLQKDIAEWAENICLQPVTYIGSTEVTTPPPAFNSAFLLLHALHHFLNEGIGLRHVCDWVCELKANHNPVKIAETARLLKRYGMTTGARIFGAVAVNYLHLPLSYIPVSYGPDDLAMAEWLLEEIWEGGNFGRYDRRTKKRPKGYWRSKWFTFRRAVRRCVNVWRLMPSEAVFYPMALALHSFQMQLKFLRHGKKR